MLWKLFKVIEGAGAMVAVALIVAWGCMFYKMAHFPGEIFYDGRLFALALLTLLFLFFFLPILIIQKARLSRPLANPLHPLWILIVASIVVIAGVAYAHPREPWKKYGVTTEWIASGATSRITGAKVSIRWRDETISDLIPGGGFDGWRYACRDIDGDGVEEIIISEGHGRAGRYVVKFVPGTSTHAPQFQTVENILAN